MNLEEQLTKYAETSIAIAALEKTREELINSINKEHLVELHKSHNSVVKIEEEAYTLTPVIDRSCKMKSEDKDKKIFKFDVQQTTIYVKK